MGILNVLKKIFFKKGEDEALLSASKRSEALLSAQKRSKALLYEPSSSLYEHSPELYEQGHGLYEHGGGLNIEKESLKLGLAAGFAGKAIREMESSLVRIESQMPTRDWMDLKIGSVLREILELLKRHEEKEEERFEKLIGVGEEKVRIKREREVLTPRMREIIKVLEEKGEVSYQELANILGLKSVSGVRSILTEMMKRTDSIERFEKNGKGWVRLSASKRSKALKSTSERGPTEGTLL